MRDVDVDVLVLGAGAAGSSLVLHLAAAGWQGTLLLVDDGAVRDDERAWAWWSVARGPADPADGRAAASLGVAGDGWARTLALGPYRYRRTTGSELRERVDAAVAAHPGMTRRTARVTSVSDEGDRATVRTADGAVLRARWVFDSVGPHGLRRDPRAGPHLDVGGMVVETAHDAFDPDVPVLMDFRTDQDDGAAFVYVLPRSPRRALVEHTRFVVPGGQTPPGPVDHDAAVRAYLADLGVQQWRPVGRERGAISLVRPRAARRRGRVVPIGARGGAVKASTGYGFAAIQRHSAGLAASLVRHGHPHAVRHPSRYYRALDAVLVTMLGTDPGAVPHVMARLFTRNPPERVLRFLDEDLAAADHVRLYRTLPVPSFARAAVVGLAQVAARGVAHAVVTGAGGAVAALTGRLRRHPVEPPAPSTEPVSAQDRVQLATDVGPVPFNVGAVLLLGGAAGGEAGAGPERAPSAESLAALVAERLGAVPRLRQRLVPGGPGRAPVWSEDRSADARRHVTHAVVTDRDAVLDVAARLVTTPLARSAPLWRAVVAAGPDGAPVAVVVALHHVLADGVGGLALLGALVDGAAGPAAAGPASPTRGPAAATPGPATPAPAAAAFPGPAARVAPRPLARLRHGLAELGRRGPGAPRTSLNAPTGPRRHVRALAVELAAVRAAARAHGATVNDLLLVAVAGALGRVLAARGEHPDHLVVSVPVAGRAATTTGALGNHVGVMPVAVPLRGSDGERLRSVAATTAARRRPGHRGASAALVGPAFVLLARLGLFRWFVDRQRLVTTFLSNLRGPEGALSVGGHPVSALLPVTVTAGNVGVAFAVLSSGGRLAVTVLTDPDVVPEGDDVAAALGAELERLTGVPCTRP